MIDLEILQKKLYEDVKKSRVNTSLLCNNFLFISEGSKKSSAYIDPKYIPFYYHLGKYIQPKNMIEVGLRLGLFSSCFLKSCKSVEYFLGFQQKNNEYYSPRFALNNIGFNYSGKIEIIVESKIPDLKTKFDLSIINEELDYDIHRIYLDTLWNVMELDGLIVHDYIHSNKLVGTAFRDFAKTKNRDIIEIKTRYGVGIVKR